MLLNKLDPRYTIYLRGFDRRGCAAAITETSANGFKITGVFSDLADFVVPVIYDADDIYGHLYTSRYLPDFNLSGIVLDFDLVISNCQNPASFKFASVPWNAISFIRADGTNGTISLPISSTTGASKASKVFTISGTTVNARYQIIYASNYVFDYYVASGSITSADVAAALATQINSNTSASVPLTASAIGANLTITCLYDGEDGNTIELFSRSANGGVISPNGRAKLSGGNDPTTYHVRIDFTTLGIDNVRQVWFTLAPSLPIDTGSSNATLVPFLSKEFSWIVSNWTITDPNNIRSLSIASRNSVVIGNRNPNCTFTGSWNVEAGFYFEGFSKVSSTEGDTVTIKYYCSAAHDLYLGTSLYVDRGIFEVSIDGTASSDLSCHLNVATALNTRRALTYNLLAGEHTIVLTVQSGICYFDFLHAVIRGNPELPNQTYPQIGAAGDLDTDQTYKLPPSRWLFNYQYAGFAGDIDFYFGVFFAFKRKRYGGNFHSAILTISGTWNFGTDQADGDALFLNISGTSFGTSVYSFDNQDTLKQRLMNAVNSLFVGVRAEDNGTGQFKITSITPINGFSISHSISSGATGTFNLSGDIAAGNEGIWQIDDLQTSPINRAASDYLADFSNLCRLAGIGLSVAFSQELLAPPYFPEDSTNAWIQKYPDGSTVLTATAFGSWGTAYVEAISFVSGNTQIKSTGHGYISGNTVHWNGVSYLVSRIDGDYFTIPGTISGSIGDQIFIDLQTSQCTFNPNTVTPYYANIFTQAAQIISSSGLVPTLQFGEILHWFFNNPSGMAYYDANQVAAAESALGRSLHTFLTPNDDPNVNSGADASFLQSRLQIHIHTIRTNVLASVPGCLFELLWPNDVNWPTSFTNGIYPYHLGGTLNRYVNLPPSYYGPGNDIDIIKMEALAWGTSYRELNNAQQSIQFPFTVGTWPRNKVRYLVPCDNGGCPWQQELLLALSARINNINLWAIDHIVLFSWDVSNLLASTNSGEIY